MIPLLCAILLALEAAHLLRAYACARLARDGRALADAVWRAR